MPIERVGPDASPEQVAETLARDGCAVVENLADPCVLDRIESEMAPYVAAAAAGPDEFWGRNTRRIGGLVARSPAARDLVAHPFVLGVVQSVLADAKSFHLHLTQIIEIGPGEPAQAIHRDQWAFDFFPFPSGYEVQCNAIWALTDFRAANGATRVIPGSNRREDRLSFGEADTEPAEMDRGSVLFYTGALYHGGGANRSDATRTGLNITYARGWLRQEENQYLTVPPDVVAALPDSLLRLIGYARGAYALGYVDDLRDPIEVVRGRTGDAGFGTLVRARERRGG